MSKSLGNTHRRRRPAEGARRRRLPLVGLHRSTTRTTSRSTGSSSSVAGEEYRKVRNTIRFLLGNLGDFDAGQDRRELTDADRRDPRRLGDGATRRARRDGPRRLRRATSSSGSHEALFNFCNDTLSAGLPGGGQGPALLRRARTAARRRRTQTVLHDIADGLIRLLAPVLVHTADEAWLALHGRGPDDVRSLRPPRAAAGAVPTGASAPTVGAGRWRSATRRCKGSSAPRRAGDHEPARRRRRGAC